MKSLKDIVCGIIALAASVIAVWQLTVFVGFRDATGPNMSAGINHLYVSILCVVIAIACVVYYLVKHPRMEEEVHITR